MTGAATLHRLRRRSRTMAGPAKPRAGRQRLVLLDPGLFFDGGHHASFARLVRAEADRRGMELAIFGGQRIDDPPVGLEIARQFRTSPYSPRGRAAIIGALRAANDDLLEDARALPIEALREARLVLIPTMTSRLTLGFARWIQELPDTFRVPVALILMFPPGLAGDEPIRVAELTVYREAMAIFASLPAGRVALFAETCHLARTFERLGAPVVQPIPWPVELAPAPARLPFDPALAPPHVAYLGNTRMETGIGLLPEVIQRVAADRAAVRFTIQANRLERADVDRCVAQIEALRRAAVIHGAMAPAPYSERLREADVILLPYDPASYRTRGSGVFAEAAAAGRVLVIPAGTWMAEQAEAWNLGAVTFPQFNAPSVSAALIEAIDDRAALLERASVAAGPWRDDRRPRLFIDRVIDALPVQAASTGGARHIGTALRVKPGVIASPVTDEEYLDEGLWTPQTQMLRAIRDWVLACPDEPVRALSIDANPTLDEILRRRWPALTIERARFPEIDVQDLGAFADDSFDLAYSHQVLEHVPKPWRAGAELVRVLRSGGLGIHTSCAHNPRHGLPAFNDYYRFLPDGLAELFDGVEVLIKAGWGNRQALLHNLAIDDGHGPLGGRRFGPAVGQPNEEDFPWHTWIIFHKR